MAATLSESALTHLARLGARARLEELEREAAAIRAAFPLEATHAPQRRRRRMSAAARRAVSVRMRKYWAARRNGKAHRNGKA